jgi:hypothetical protein
MYVDDYFFQREKSNAVDGVLQLLSLTTTLVSPLFLQLHYRGCKLVDSRPFPLPTSGVVALTCDDPALK